MTQERIENNFWAVGKSSKVENGQEMGLIGRFGIGGLAVINICESLVVRSRNIWDHRSIVTSIETSYEVNPELNYVPVEDDESPMEHTGTIIRAVLKTGRTMGSNVIEESISALRSALRYTKAVIQLEVGNSVTMLEPEIMDLGLDGTLKLNNETCHRNFNYTSQVEMMVSGYKTVQQITLFVSAEFDIYVDPVSNEFFAVLTGVSRGLSEENQADLKGKGKLKISHGGAEIGIYSNGYGILELKENINPTNGFQLSGEIDIQGLEPLASRDSLIQSDQIMVENILKHILKSLWEHIKYYSMEKGMECIPDLQRYYNMTYSLDHTCEGLAPFVVDFDYHSERDKASLMELKNEEINYCTKYALALQTIAETHKLIRLDSLTSPSWSPGIIRYLINFCNASDVSGYTFDDMFDEEELMSKISNRQEYVRLKSIYDAMNQLLFTDMYNLPEDQVELKFCKTMPSVHCTTIESKVRQVYHMEIFINCNSQQILEDGDQQTDQITYRDIIFDKYVREHVFKIWRNFPDVIERPVQHLGSLSVSFSEIKEYNLGPPGNYWEGPEGEMIYIKTWVGVPVSYTGYYMRMNPTYWEEVNNWRPAFNNCSGNIRFQLTGGNLQGKISWNDNMGDVVFSIQRGTPLRRKVPDLEIEVRKPILSNYETGIFLPIPDEALDMFRPENGEVMCVYIGARLNT
eukprot:TRINITY_DN1767_c0_g1_i3.p1 TRINITY_DN1767_c0_g1~~TRINITY_DN1767_c0_g1_i3.p1  ORF type:complete len:689 (+),score=123.92 TRINITY_DN1767_c0_g1_i3:778-2844(+)